MFAPLKSQRRKLKWGLGILINISQSCLPREINRQEPAASGKIYTIGTMETNPRVSSTWFFFSFLGKVFFFSLCVQTNCLTGPLKFRKQVTKDFGSAVKLAAYISPFLTEFPICSNINPPSHTWAPRWTLFSAVNVMKPPPAQSRTWAAKQCKYYIIPVG